uniref:MYND-type domain-containing protein n=1 Tax=Oryza brachyantha TaxID=4533 RepID=J3L1H7_ORYBR
MFLLAPKTRFCCWCGTWKGEKICSCCRKASYCSKKHQELHWRAKHKNECRQISGSHDATAILQDAGKAFAGNIWPEYIVVDEIEKPSSFASCENRSELLVAQGQSEQDDMMASLMDQFEADDDNRCWSSFLERISRDQHQILRYCRESTAKPLWQYSGSLANAAIPSCIYCNGPLCYEFQIMPQLLHYFLVENGPDSLDWATIIVYTCKGSCDQNVSYMEEFVWVQLSPPATSRRHGKSFFTIFEKVTQGAILFNVKMWYLKTSQTFLRDYKHSFNLPGSRGVPYIENFRRVLR